MNYNKENKETKLIIEGKEFQIIPFKIEKNPRWYIPELGLVIELKRKQDKVAPHNYYFSGASGSIGNDFKENPLKKMINYDNELIYDLNVDLENFLDEKIRLDIKK